MRFIFIASILTLTTTCLGDFIEDVTTYDIDDDRVLLEDNPCDIYVVQNYPVHDDDYKDFVHTILKAKLDTDGHVFVKTADEEIRRVESSDGMDNISLYGNTGNVLKDVTEVLLLEGFRWNIVLLLKIEFEVEDGVETVMALVNANQARINIVTMETGQHVQISRRKRQTSGQPSVYQQIATASGGMVITTTKNNILAVSQLLKQGVKSNLVDIMRFEWPGSKAGKYFQIPVDDTMTQMILQIQTPSARPMAMLSYPKTGLPVPPTAGKLLGTRLELYEFNITKATDLGQWKITKIGRSDWDVEVTGQSPVGFTFEFMEPGREGIGMYPLKGRPIAGKTYQIVAKVPNYAMIKSVNVMLPLGNDNMPVGMPTMIHSVGGRRGKEMFTANMTMPPQDFKVAIDGLDKNNNQVRRLAPFMVFPISVDLSVPTLKDVLYVNETLTIPFTVINTASKIQDVLIHIEDSERFAKSPMSLFYTMKGGENVTSNFTIVAGPLVGVTDTVVITAKPYIKSVVIKGQYAIRRFTVREIPTTTLPTTVAATPSTANPTTPLTTQSLAANRMPKPTTASHTAQPPTIPFKTVHKEPLGPVNFLQDLKGLHGYLRMKQRYVDTDYEVKLDK